MGALRRGPAARTSAEAQDGLEPPAKRARVAPPAPAVHSVSVSAGSLRGKVDVALTENAGLVLVKGGAVAMDVDAVAVACVLRVPHPEPHRKQTLFLVRLVAPLPKGLQCFLLTVSSCRGAAEDASVGRVHAG